MIKDKKTKNISLKLSEDDYEWLRNKAEAEDRAISGIVRRAVKAYRDQEDPPGVRGGDRHQEGGVENDNRQGRPRNIGRA